MKKPILVGVLALQGDFACHLSQLESLQVAGCEVRRADDLNDLDALIIPGGESTTMSELIDRFDMRLKLTEFVRHRAVWGTCAGSILLARKVDDPRVRPLGAVDMVIRRNAYGRQVHSFYDEIEARLNGTVSRLKASFIRAPIIEELGGKVTILAEYQGSPVLIEQGRCLVSTFHSELHDNTLLTRYFLECIVLDGRKGCPG